MAAKNPQAKKEPKATKTTQTKKSNAMKTENIPTQQTTSGATIFFAAIAIILLFGSGYLYMQAQKLNEKLAICEEKTGSACSCSIDTKNITTQTQPTAKAKLDLYVMSMCPYGTQAEDSMEKVLDFFGEKLDFNLYFIANPSGEGFSSLHGQPEVDEDMRQACAMKHYPENYFDFILCRNKNIGADWKSCATGGIDAAVITTCFEGAEGKQLLADNIKKANELNIGSSPTIYINDQQYAGARDATSLMRAVCATMPEEAACKSLPAPAKVPVVVLTDARCKECDTTGLVWQLRGIFPGMALTQYDYSTEAGKALYKETGIKTLPAVLFTDDVKKAENYANVQAYLVAAGDYYSLRIGADFDPTAEICDNGIDDTGEGMVDCADDTCKGTLECREEIKNNLQVFVMSDCPYGRKAIEALKEVVGNFGDKITYEVHYIASEAGDGFSSLHGQYEVDEDIIQLCVKEKSPSAWLGYMYCRATKGVRGIDWKTCAGETKVDASAVQACFDGTQGKELLREDIKMADSLGIGSSPTWLANNKKTFGGIDAQTVKTNFCAANAGLEGCNNTLSGGTGGSDTPQCQK